MANFNSDRNTTGVGLTAGGATATGIGATALVASALKRNRDLAIAGALLGTTGIATMSTGIGLAKKTERRNDAKFILHQ